MDTPQLLAGLCLVLILALSAALSRNARLKRENGILRRKLSPFDGDGDGYPGGSRKRAASRPGWDGP